LPGNCGATGQKIAEEQAVPFIVHWKQNHFVVVYKIKRIKSFAFSETLNSTFKQFRK
jgi:ABC-type bacteriocin/lantibiotic exporter with double-glycine peptidase domain